MQLLLLNNIILLLQLDIILLLQLNIIILLLQLNNTWKEEKFIHIGVYAI